MLCALKPALLNIVAQNSNHSKQNAKDHLER